MMVKLEDTFVSLAIPHPIFEVNHMKVSKVQPKFWHAIMAKLHDLLTRLAMLIEPMLFLGLLLCTMRKECFN